MAEKGKHRLTDYERLMCRLPVFYRPALRLERIHFRNMAGPKYEYESRPRAINVMLLEMFSWDQSKHGYEFWKECHDKLLAREAAEKAKQERVDKKKERLNRLLAKQLEDAAH